jgi:hypothetical protein
MFTIRTRGEAGHPFSDERVTALLDAASAPADAGPTPGEAAALAAFRAAHQDGPVRSRPRAHSPATSLRTVSAAVLGAGVLLTGGVTAAQAGMLPGPAQDIAHRMLDKVGVSVPGADEHSTGHVDRRGSTEAPDRSGDAGSAAGAGSEEAGKGSEISDLARDPRYSGVEKGAKVSTKASDGRSRAGQHDEADAPDHPRGDTGAGENARVTTPNTGGSDRPDQVDGGAGNQGSNVRGDAAGQGRVAVTAPNRGTATDGSGDRASLPGTTTADAASGGRSSAGADNRLAVRPDSPGGSLGNRP